MKAITVLASAILASGLMAGAAAAQAPAAPAPAAPDIKRIGSFVVRCFPVKSVAPCDLYQDRVNRETGQRVLSFSIAYMPAGNRYILQIAVPLGVAIDKGVVISGGGFTSPTLPFRRCDQSGCFVEAAIDKNLIDAFAKLSGDAKITVVPDGGKAFDFPFSFDGFASAHDDMVSSNKAKAVSPDATQAPAAPAQPAK